MIRIAWLALSVGLLALIVSCGRPATDDSLGSSCIAVHPDLATARSVPLPQSLLRATDKPVNNADESIAYLMDTYQMSRSEAERQLNLQVESADLGDWLRERYPNELGDLRLDHEPPGTIVVPTTDPATLSSDSELARYPHRTSVVIERVVWSQRTVQAMEECLYNRLGGAGREAQFLLDFDPVAGQVWVTAADTDAGRAFLASDAVIAEVAASSGVIGTRTHPELFPN